MLLELAVAAGAAHTVTHNARHFHGAESFGVHVACTLRIFAACWAATMSALTVQLPDSLHGKLRAFAEADGASVKQLVAAAVGARPRLPHGQTSNVCLQKGRRGRRNLMRCWNEAQDIWARPILVFLFCRSQVALSPGNLSVTSRPLDLQKSWISVLEAPSQRKRGTSPTECGFAGRLPNLDDVSMEVTTILSDSKWKCVLLPYSGAYRESLPSR